MIMIGFFRPFVTRRHHNPPLIYLQCNHFERMDTATECSCPIRNLYTSILRSPPMYWKTVHCRIFPVCVFIPFFRRKALLLCFIACFKTLFLALRDVLQITESGVPILTMSINIYIWPADNIVFCLHIDIFRLYYQSSIYVWNGHQNKN